MLRVEGVSVRLKSMEILKDVTFELREGDLIALLGPNGSGKSTILRTLFGLLKPVNGVVYLDGKTVHGMKIQDVAKILGYLPQENSETNLRVIDVVLLGRTPYVGLTPSNKDLKIALEALELVGLKDFENRYFSELSGGEKQKVMLARIFCQQTDFLLLDEPTSHLDIRSQVEVMNIVKRMVDEGKAAIIAIHDINLAASFCNRILMVKNGRIAYAGKSSEVINPESIRDVFGVEVDVVRYNGRALVVPKDVMG
jgi:iron complex transport system ATP-binding protein